MRTLRNASTLACFSATLGFWLVACSSSNFSSNSAVRKADANASNKRIGDPNGSGIDGDTLATNNGAGTGGSDGSNGPKAGGLGNSGNGAGGVDGGNDAGGAIGSNSGMMPVPKINFGMLVNDLDCTFCHLEVHGTVGSVGTVAPLREDSYGKVFGRWLVNGDFNAAASLRNPPLQGGIVVGSNGASNKYNNSGKELPVDPKTGAVTFPTIDFNALSAKMRGTLKSVVDGVNVSKVYPGNLVMVGTAAKPMVIDKDVLVQGDLVLSGFYTGVGTIYVTGNIYMPNGLQAAHLAQFPYSDDPVTAKVQAQADLTAGAKDGLGLATAKNIFVGDLENYMDSSSGATGKTGTGGTQYKTLYESDSGPLMMASSNGVRDVYKWLPEAKFEKYYTSGTPCWTSSSRVLAPGHQWGERVFSRIDAFLYAASAIAGVNRALNWTINGGMIAQTMHIVSGAGSDVVLANAACGASRINFDYRMSLGLPMLEALAPFFPAQ